MNSSHSYWPTIPKIIHQTWKNNNIPGPTHWPDSWKKINPDWDYRLWTDADLLALVQRHYPALEELYTSYPNPVQRADLGRYLVLHHCGGIYADIDTECLSPLDPLSEDKRVIFAEEPVEHHHHTIPLGLNRQFFNGIMASPKGHPFWEHMIEMVVRCRHAKNFVLESTGPIVLSGAVKSYPDQDQLCLNSCHIFNPLTVTGRYSAAHAYGDYLGYSFANHYWSSSWFTIGRRKWITTLKEAWRKLQHKLTRGPYLTRTQLRQQINMSVLYQPIAPSDQNVSILIPVRDAEPFLDQCIALLTALDYPKNRIKIVFCEGDSIDGTHAKLAQFATSHAGIFRDIQILQYKTNAPLDRSQRWRAEIQRTRRSNLAKVRNYLVPCGVDQDDHWALWIDADVCDYDPCILNRLLAEKAKVVTPDCVREWGGPSYDLNAFHDDGDKRDHHYYRYVRNGIFSPPANYLRRRHLHSLRYLDRVPLSSVGGTMLLVHSSVFRAGITFPENPYDHLLETEGFGRICRDLGVTPIGLPNVHIKHVNS
mgnify:CR=1 FL=1